MRTFIRMLLSLVQALDVSRLLQSRNRNRATLRPAAGPQPLGLDGQVGRLREILNDTRATLDAFEQHHAAAVRKLMAADYAMLHVRRDCGGLVPARLTVVGGRHAAPSGGRALGARLAA
jgi:hypothetical protein